MISILEVRRLDWVRKKGRCIVTGSGGDGDYILKSMISILEVRRLDWVRKGLEAWGRCIVTGSGEMEDDILKIVDFCLYLILMFTHHSCVSFS